MKAIPYLFPMAYMLAGYWVTAALAHQAPPLMPWGLMMPLVLMTIRPEDHVPLTQRAWGMLAGALVLGAAGWFDEAHCAGCGCAWQGAGVGLMAGYALPNLLRGDVRLNHNRVVLTGFFVAAAVVTISLLWTSDRQCLWAGSAAAVYFGCFGFRFKK